MKKRLLLKPEERTRVGNGTSLWPLRIDGRTAKARRFKELYFGLINDMGGPDSVTVAQDQLARRAAAQGAALELMEAAWVQDDDPLPEAYDRTTNSQSRVLARLGMARDLKDITPTATQWAKGK